MDASIPALLRGTARHARRHAVPIVVLLVALALESLYDVSVRYSVKFLIDHAIVPRRLEMLGWILGLLLAGALLFHAIVVGSDALWARTGGRIVNSIRLELFAHLQSLPVGYFRTHPPGDLGTRFNADVALVESGMVLGLPTAVMGLVEITATLLVMAFVHPVLALVVSLGLALAVAAPRLFQRSALAASVVLRDEEGRMAGYVQGNLASQGVVKAFGLETHATRDFAARLERLSRVLTRATFLSYLVSRLPTLVFLVTQLAVLGVGGALAIAHRISVGDVVAYQVLFVGLGNAVYNLTWMTPAFIEAAAGWQRIREVLEEKPAIADAHDAVPLPRFSDAIVFEDVSFRYPGAVSDALDHVQLAIEHGSFVAIVGPSGAGKSTLLNLLLRFEEVAGGRISVDGRDVRSVTRASLRGQIGLVSQDVVLLETSVSANIRAGRLDAEDAAVHAAARAAGIDAVIERLPEGYETDVGSRGSRFSGGERQRIALARALIREPTLLILDEFTSALDPATERDVLAAVLALRGRCTILAVTHRHSIAHAADRVVVIRDGRVAASGRPTEVLEAGAGHDDALWSDPGSQPGPSATETRP